MLLGINYGGGCDNKYSLRPGIDNYKSRNTRSGATRSNVSSTVSLIYPKQTPARVAATTYIGECALYPVYSRAKLVLPTRVEA